MTVSVKDFGTVGDGIADDTAAIQQALDSGAARVLVPDGVYRLTTSLYPRSRQTLEIQGVLRVADAVIQAVKADVAAGQSRVVVEDASAFYPGQWVALGDDNLPRQKGGSQVRAEGAECARIAAIDGNAVILDGVLRRTFSVAANARLGTMHSAILIENCEHVRICGSGFIDGNKSHQYDVAPSRCGDVRGEETRAGCCIAGEADKPGHLRFIVVEGITAQNAILHNICLREVEYSTVRDTNCIGAHDKNIILITARDCRIINNTALRSDFEDGIILHQKTGCRRILIQGNICAENPRNGLHVGADENEVHLAGNMCVNNRTNIFLAGDNCSSTGDVSIVDDDATLRNKAGFVLYGRNNTVTGLSTTGSPENLVVGAVDSAVTGGLAGGTGSVPSGVGVNIVTRRGYTSAFGAERVVISGMLIKKCAVGVQAEGNVSASLNANRFQDNECNVAPETARGEGVIVCE